jgi:hypothetical protein
MAGECEKKEGIPFLLKLLFMMTGEGGMRCANGRYGDSCTQFQVGYFRCRRICSILGACIQGCIRCANGRYGDSCTQFQVGYFRCRRICSTLGRMHTLRKWREGETPETYAYMRTCQRLSRGCCYFLLARMNHMNYEFAHKQISTHPCEVTQVQSRTQVHSYTQVHPHTQTPRLLLSSPENP